VVINGGMAGKSHSANIRRYPKREVWMTKEEYLRQKSIMIYFMISYRIIIIKSLVLVMVIV